MEPTHATACNIGNCNIKRRWEDISDSDEFPFTPQADLFFVGDSEDDDGDDYDEAAAFSQAHVSTQTEIAFWEEEDDDLMFVDAPTSDNDVSLPRSLCLDLLCVAAPTAQTISLTSCVSEERNAALLSELRDLTILVASMRSDADCMRADLGAELKEMVAKHSIDMKKSLMSLWEACLSAEAAKTVECFVTA